MISVFSGDNFCSLFVRTVTCHIKAACFKIDAAVAVDTAVE